MQRKAIAIGVGLALGGCTEFSILVEREPGGLLLGGWSEGDDLIAVGGHLDGSGGTLVQVNGKEVCMEADFADRAAWWIHGDGQGSWTAVGETGLIVSSENNTRSDESVETESTLFGVWQDGDHTWAVGGDVWGSGLGQIWLRQDGEWTLEQDEVSGVLYKVWEDWIVGDGVILRREGDAWVDHTPAEAPRLLTVRGRSSDDVWAVGGEVSAELWHWNGTQWSQVDVSPYCTNQPLNGVWTAPGEEVYIAGMSGAMGWWDGTEWHCPDVPLTGEHFHAVWPHQGDTYWLGGDLFSSGDNHATIGRWGKGKAAVGVTGCDD